ncbi:MAG: TolC family protein [Gemmatimonadetes bacterium]|nr:TolC family protein [Gemmatimonadota bacterium]
MITSLLLVAGLAAAQDTSRLTLAVAVDRALASYPTVAAARARADGAAADVGAAQAAWLPRVSLDGSLNRFQEPMVVAPLHGFDPTNPPLFGRTLIQSGLSLNWTLFDFGGRTARVRVQRALAGAADAALAGAELQLIARVVTGYLRVLTARDLVAAQDQRLAALAAAAARTRQLIAEGKAARVDGLRVDAEARRAEADRIGSAAQLDVAEHQLAQLTQLPYQAVHGASLVHLRLADPTYATDTSAAVRAALVARARQASAELHEAEQRARAADATLGVARAAWFPELRVAGAYIDRGRWTGDFAAEWQVGVALSYSLFTGGGRQSAVRRAAADGRAAAAQLRAVGLNVEQGVDQALAGLRQAHARVAALQSAVEQSAEVARIEQLSLEVGSGTQTDYLAAEANLLSARAGLIEARHSEIGARVELARIIGELSRDWLARIVEPVP